MYIATESIFKVEFDKLLTFGTIEDARVKQIEAAVVSHYNTTVLQMLDWRKDTDAKLMVCFLLNQKLNYSIASLSNWYGINRQFLTKCIIEQYTRCLTDGVQMQLAASLVACLGK